MNNKLKLAKLFCMGTTVIGMVGTLVSSWVSEQEAEAKIQKLFNEYVKNQK